MVTRSPPTDSILSTTAMSTSRTHVQPQSHALSDVVIILSPRPCKSFSSQCYYIVQTPMQSMYYLLSFFPATIGSFSVSCLFLLRPSGSPTDKHRRQG